MFQNSFEIFIVAQKKIIHWVYGNWNGDPGKIKASYCYVSTVTLINYSIKC